MLSNPTVLGKSWVLHTPETDVIKLIHTLWCFLCTLPLSSKGSFCMWEKGVKENKILDSACVMISTETHKHLLG